MSRIRRLEYFKKVILSAVLFFILFLPLGWAEEEESKSELKFIQFHSIYWHVCQKMEPIVDRVKKKYKSQLREFQILDILTDNGKEKVEKYGIAYTPTFIIVDKDDKEIDRLIGGVEQQVLERFIDGNIKRWKKKRQ